MDGYNKRKFFWSKLENYLMDSWGIWMKIWWEKLGKWETINKTFHSILIGWIILHPYFVPQKNSDSNSKLNESNHNIVDIGTMIKSQWTIQWTVDRNHLKMLTVLWVWPKLLPRNIRLSCIIFCGGMSLENRNKVQLKSCTRWPKKMSKLEDNLWI